MFAYALAFPGALAIGLSLGLLGSGGSILTVPVLVYLLGQNEKVAIAGSLAIVGSIALIGSLPYIRQKMVVWPAVLLFGLPGMLGTYTGAWLSNFVSGATQLGVFALVMMAAAYYMLKPTSVLNPPTMQPRQRASLRIGVDGLLVGILTGFVGVGGGFLIVPALTLLGGLSMRQAVATSLLIIAMKSFAGFFKYTDVLAEHNLSLDFNIIACVTLIGVIGSFGGSAVGGLIPQRALQKGFGCFLIVMASFILARSAPAALFG